MSEETKTGGNVPSSGAGEVTPCDKPKKVRPIPPRQRLFVKYYLTGVKGKFVIANGTKSYAEAYGRTLPKDENLCSTNSYKLLRKAKIIAYMQEFNRINGFNDEAVDSRLREIMFTEKGRVSTQAIKEYNNLQARILKRIDHTTDGKPLPILNVISSNDSHKKDTEAKGKA